MLKLTLKTLLLAAFLSANLYAQDKGDKKTEGTPEDTANKNTPKVKVMEKTTAVSEKASLDKELDDISSDQAVIMQNETASGTEISEEMKNLLNARKKVIEDLSEADSEMNKLIIKSQTWDKERNTEKKGQLDTILDKADRLSFSNELRVSLSSQAKVISAIIKKLNKIELNIKEQEMADEKKRQMEAYRKHIERLELERKALMAKLKEQESGEVKVNATEAVQKKNEENVEYFTITEDTNLQTIALQYYQDHEKWVIILDHPDNKQVLKEKSPTAIIPIGSVLTIPKITEE